MTATHREMNLRLSALAPLTKAHPNTRKPATHLTAPAAGVRHMSNPESR
ncbi:hypothetical protein [Actinokineospora sp. HUAS TT18]